VQDRLSSAAIAKSGERAGSSTRRHRITARGYPPPLPIHPPYPPLSLSLFLSLSLLFRQGPTYALPARWQLRGFSITPYVSVNCDMHSRSRDHSYNVHSSRSPLALAYALGCIRNDPIPAEKFSSSDAPRIERYALLHRETGREREMPLLRLLRAARCGGPFNKRRPRSRAIVRAIRADECARDRVPI